MDLSARGIGLVVATATSIPAPWRWAAEELPTTPRIEEVSGPSLVPLPARLILPAPWWYDDGAVPTTPCIEEQGGYQPTIPPRSPIAWPPPQGDEALPIAAALLALADDGWTLGRAIETGWEPGPTWLIDASEVVGPTVEEHPWLRLTPAAAWTPPVAPWRWPDEGLPISAAPLGIDEGEWVRLVPAVAEVPPRVAAQDDHVLPIAAAPLALDEGEWVRLVPPAAVLPPPVALQDDHALPIAAPPLAVDDGEWRAPLLPPWVPPPLAALSDESLPIPAAPLAVDEGEWLQLVPPATLVPAAFAAALRWLVMGVDNLVGAESALVFTRLSGPRDGLTRAGGPRYDMERG